MQVKNLYAIKLRLAPEQNKVFEDVVMQWEDTIQAYKHLQKKYSGVKKNIKAIEKKLVIMLNDLPEKDFTPIRIEHEIGRIENKYIAIDKAIKNYKQCMQSFNHIVSLPNFSTFNPHLERDWFITGLKNPLYSANSEINQGLDAIRITKRYFNNITNAFKYYAERQKMLKQIALRTLPPPPPAPDASIS
jgi:exonuclease VII small subunit